jgi:hypothetical protein
MTIAFTFYFAGLSAASGVACDMTTAGIVRDMISPIHSLQKKRLRHKTHDFLHLDPRITQTTQAVTASKGCAASGHKRLRFCALAFLPF